MNAYPSHRNSVCYRPVILATKATNRIALSPRSLQALLRSSFGLKRPCKRHFYGGGSTLEMLARMLPAWKRSEAHAFHSPPTRRPRTTAWVCLDLRKVRLD